MQHCVSLTIWFPSPQKAVRPIPTHVKENRHEAKFRNNSQCARKITRGRWVRWINILRRKHENHDS
ncbi:hypothetical protein COCC4DRAFT_31813 [Bipolaris maydis ATCC 48331]|uniref:Uncharacterized protein n=2 Tax=Cochliobolus heterostrophus TaxID=5016 RepID=M2UBA1_COCH5|nr:uncharacterized protein COCC4DRAFT_31813 [Bipolaris maydis ATCC 48331]EMD90976.1 hypothetical protein COCHEDRAFT_1021746 [Bipolaris maydis C5]ENI05940.1 hypothetical protein COCC4DRAFT_31813 [Bipolaris maydis ATCC 48331]